MRPICLTQGQIAVVDDADFDWLSKYNWYAHKGGGRDDFYAVRNSHPNKNGKREMIAMHRQILGLEQDDPRVADHRNHNTLDNRRDNIWACTHTQNMQNRKKKTLDSLRRIC